MNSTARTASARDDGKSRLRHAYSLCAVGVNVVLLFMLVVVTVQASRSLRRERLWEIHTLEVKNSIRSTALAFMDCESNQRSYLLTGNETFAKAYRVGRVDVLLMVDRLDTMTKDNPRQQARVSRIAKLMKLKLEYMDSFMQKRRDEGASWDGMDLRRGHDLIVAIRAILGDMDRDENAILVVRARRMDSILGRILTGIFVLLGNNVLLVVAIVSGMMSYFEAVRQARRSGTPDPDALGPLGSQF
jgi:CHASE3 domain sensor protein